MRGLVMRSVASGVLRALGVVSLALFLLLAVGPRTGLYRPVTVLSNSMQPTFERGDLAIATPEPTTSVTVGQVLTMRIPVGDRRVESHRVVEVLQPRRYPIVRTRGDAADAADPWQAQLDPPTAWRVTHVLPYLGWLVMWLRTPFVHVFAVFVAPALLAIQVLIAIWRRPAAPRPGVAEGSAA